MSEPSKHAKAAARANAPKDDPRYLIDVAAQNIDRLAIAPALAEHDLEWSKALRFASAVEFNHALTPRSAGEFLRDAARIHKKKMAERDAEIAELRAAVAPDSNGDPRVDYVAIAEITRRQACDQERCAIALTELRAEVERLRDELVEDHRREDAEFGRAWDREITELRSHLVECPIDHATYYAVTGGERCPYDQIRELAQVAAERSEKLGELRAEVERLRASSFAVVDCESCGCEIMLRTGMARDYVCRGCGLTICCECVHVFGHFLPDNRHDTGNPADAVNDLRAKLAAAESRTLEAAKETYQTADQVRRNFETGGEEG